MSRNLNVDGCRFERRAETRLFEEYCTDLTVNGWVDNDAVNGVSDAYTLSGQKTIRFDTNTAAPGNQASGYVDLSALTPGSKLEFSFGLYLSSVGTQANGDGFEISYEWAGAKFSAQFCSDGLFLWSGGSWVEVVPATGEDIIATGEWNRFTFEVDTSTPASATCYVYKGVICEGYALSCIDAGSYTNGKLTFTQYGATSNDNLSYIDDIVVKSDDYPQWSNTYSPIYLEYASCIDITAVAQYPMVRKYQVVCGSGVTFCLVKDGAKGLWSYGNLDCSGVWRFFSTYDNVTVKPHLRIDLGRIEHVISNDVSSSGVVTIDCKLGHYHRIDLTEDISGVVITNPVDGFILYLLIAQPGSASWKFASPECWDGTGANAEIRFWNGAGQWQCSQENAARDSLILMYDETFNYWYPVAPASRRSAPHGVTYVKHVTSATLGREWAGEDIIHCNEGAGGTVVLTLPADDECLVYRFVRSNEDQVMEIDPNGGEYIRYGAVTGGSGKKLILGGASEAAAARLLSIKTNVWDVVDSVGVLTFEA